MKKPQNNCKRCLNYTGQFKRKGRPRKNNYSEGCQYFYEQLTIFDEACIECAAEPICHKPTLCNKKK